MDQTTLNAVNAVIADLANDSGGTYQQGTFLPFRPESGFAVASPNGLTLPAEVATPSMVAWALRQVSRENPTASYVGTWLDEGVIYFDAVTYFGADRPTAALQAARANGQKAIYDFGQKVSITL